MDIILNQIVKFIIWNHSITIPLLTIFSIALALLAWNQIKLGWLFYISKRKLVLELSEKGLKNYL